MNSKKHKLPRRLLAMLLAICMFVTMFPSGMLAEPGDGGDSAQESSKTVIEKTETDSNGVTFKKTATRTSATTWDVQIDITPEEDIKSAPLDVVLVLDTSPSMAWDLSGVEDSEPDWGEDSRLKTMQKAAINLINELAEVGNVNVGLVQFDEEASIESQLISLDNDNNTQNLQRKINRLTTERHNGTNISDGLDTAGSVLQTSGTQGSQKVVILLSDGEPNYPKKPSHSDDWDSSEEYAAYMARGSADVLRNTADIYTVGFLAADTADLLTYIAGDASRYYQAENAADLVEAFTNIAYEITAMVNDDVGDDVEISGTPSVELDGQTYTNGKLTVSDDKSHLLWNPDEEDGISKGQTLTIKYTVTLKDSAETLWNEDQQDNKDQSVSVLVNEDAGLSYQITGQTDIYNIDLEPLQDNVELAKLTEYNAIDTNTNKTQIGDSQYVFIYSDTDTGQQSFSWMKPEGTWNNANYSSSTIGVVNGSTTDATDSTSYIPSTKGEYELIHHYTTAPTKPSDDEVIKAFGDEIVTIDCVNTNYKHDNVSSALLKGTFIVGDVSQNDGVYTVQVTVTPNDAYATAYNNAQETAKNHTLVAGQTEKTLTLQYNSTDKKWEPTSNDGITIQVTCPNPQDISGITKEVVTEDDVKSLPETINAKDYDIPKDDKTMTFTEGEKESVTLLYKITVTGDPGTKYTVTDDDAKFVEPTSGTGEIPENGTMMLYVSKTFDLEVGTNTLTNSASVTNDSGGSVPSDNPVKEDVTVEVVPTITPGEVIDEFDENPVSVKCTNALFENQHTQQYYEMTETSLTLGNVILDDGDYIVTVTLDSQLYVDLYNGTYNNGHTFVSDNEKQKTITLKYNMDTGNWDLTSDDEIVISVVCPDPATITGFNKEVLTQDEIEDLGIEGEYDNPAKESDKVVAAENDTITLMYKITVQGDAGTNFSVSDPGATLVESNIDLEAGTQNTFAGTIPEDGSDVVLYVSMTFTVTADDTKVWNKAEITSTDQIDDQVDKELEVPVDVEVIPTPDFEALLKGAVKVDCVTEGVDHADGYYDLTEDTCTIDGSGAHYVVSINAEQAAYYVKKYNEDVTPNHVYQDGLQGNTITLNYSVEDGWKVEGSPIVIAVKCAGLDDVTAFEKNVITSNDIDNLPDAVKSRTDYVVPGYADGKVETVTVPENGTVTLLYVIKVEGTAGTSFTVTDEGADLVYSDYDVVEGEGDTFTGTISKDGSAIFYVTRTFTSDEVGAEEDGVLRNSASIAVDEGTVDEDEKDETEDVPAVVGPETDVVKVTPADVTIYEGGNGGYDGVGADAETSTSLPHPMFYISTPDGVDPTGLTFTNDGKVWTVVADGTDADGKPLYHFEQGEGQEPVRVTYTYVNQTTGKETTVLSDNLDELDDVADVYTYLRIDLYAGENNLDSVKANVNGVGYAVDTGSGTLTVRAVEAADPNTVTSDIRDTAPTADEGTAVAVEPENTTYTLNDTQVKLPADSQPSLLFDNIINDDGVNRTAALENKADQKLNADSGDYNYEIMYLDLVDANNGNAWIKSSKGTDIYWDYPEGTDKNTDFQVLHFTGLHREGDQSGFDIEDLNNIDMSEIENVTIEKADNYIVFHVTEANFSPYALAWDADNGSSDNPGGWHPSNPGGDGPSGLNTEDHFSYIVGYAEDYRTGEATDDESLWPVKPQNNITRAEVATIFYRLLEDEVRDEYDTTVNNFSDVSADAWYNQTVSTLSSMGIVKGYEDGTFRPNAPITRAEFGAIATRFFEETGATYEPGTFSDVVGDEWFAGAIQDAVNLGLIGGYEDGTVRPNNNITRAEACAIVNRTLGRVPDVDHLLPEDVMKTWPDNPESAWFYADMQEATNGHEYEWITEDGNKVENWTEIMLDNDWTGR